ncbi:MAG: arsenosugar biosynthesis radical SAM (seleno)protein ArsS [Cyclobacteriaceae bacterium]
MVKKSLSARHNPLASPVHQLEVLEHQSELPSFAEKLAEAGLPPLSPAGIEILQINIGKMCNQVCGHCHVDAGPDRKEIMTRDTMNECLNALQHLNVKTVDITGGAPELNPDFRWFIEAIRSLGKHVIVRCNLTIILANKKFYDLPVFYKEHKIEIASSLPFYNADRTDRQRGEGVFTDSIKALQMLNEVGYGKPDTGLLLNLVYNPSGAFLPGNQDQMERDFKSELKKHYGIVFNKLFCITNMPISRYLDYLISSGNYEKYMDRLISAFNPVAAQNVMCHNTLSVGWDGSLYDCDFNQMLELTVDANRTHISNFSLNQLSSRKIRVNQHCFGCTAGTGSSCGGSTT